MAYLVAIVYPDEHRAAEVMATLKRLQSEYLLDLKDACYVTRDKQSGKIQLHQAVNLTAMGAATGAFWGALIGMIFFMPLVGLAIGAASGALGGKLSDYGIDDNFIKSVGAKVEPGTSAIFMLVRRATVDKVEPEIAKFGGQLLYSNLAKETEEKLQRLLEESAEGKAADATAPTGGSQPAPGEASATPAGPQSAPAIATPVASQATPVEPPPKPEGAA